MRYLIIILSIFIFTNSNAQYDDEPRAQETQPIKWDKPPVMKAKNICASLRVIDMRANKKSIGNTKTGVISNQQEPLTVTPSLEAFLQDAYQKMKPTAMAGTGELIFVVYNLSLEDRPDGTETGTLYFDADVFRDQDGKYKFLNKIDSFYEARATLDVSNKLVKMFLNKMASIIGYYANKDNKETDEKIYTLEEITNKRITDKVALPIYNSSGFKKGIYYTVDQFINNMPVDTPFVRKTYTWDMGFKANFFHYAKSNGKAAERINEKNFFAIYDGEKWWVSDINFCSAMNYSDGEFRTVKYFKQAYSGKNASGASAVGAVFGIVGFLITEGIDEAMQTGKSNKADWGRYKSKFNPVTKQFVPVARAQ
ncbi:MAG: hypothetical protein JST82_11060 [Bacteroidetes bacterium]|nr:hypothetical protein [Bacteroidota bacterium]